MVGVVDHYAAQTMESTFLDDVRIFIFIFFFTVTSDPMRFRRLRDDPTAVTTDVSFSFLSENNKFFLM